ATNFGKGVQNTLDVFGMHVETFRCNNHVFLAAPVIQPAFGVDLAEIAGVKPIPAGSSDAFAAHQDLTVGRDLDLLAFDYFAHGSSTGVEGMVHSDYRAG